MNGPKGFVSRKDPCYTTELKGITTLLEVASEGFMKGRVYKRTVYRGIAQRSPLPRYDDRVLRLGAHNPLIANVARVQRA